MPEAMDVDYTFKLVFLQWFIVHLLSCISLHALRVYAAIKLRLVVMEEDTIPVEETLERGTRVYM